MNPYFQQLIAQTVLKTKKKKTDWESKPPSRYKMAKALYRARKIIFQSVRDAVFIIIGILSAGFGLKSFLLPNNFIDGGATGISLLITEITDQPLFLIIVLVNIPFILIGFRQISKIFGIKTILSIIGLAVCLAFVPYPIITNEKILVAVFGGFFLGAGIGMAMRGGSVLDGTEVLAIYISRKTSVSIGDIIMLINIVIFSSAVYLLNWDVALYSMLTYLAASKTVDFIIEGIEEYTGVTIISPKSDEIVFMITEKLGRGVTVYKGQGGYGKRGYANSSDMKIVFTVITRLEISKLKSELNIIDPNAFVVMHSIKDTKGGMIKKRALDH